MTSRGRAGLNLSAAFLEDLESVRAGETEARCVWETRLVIEVGGHAFDADQILKFNLLQNSWSKSHKIWAAAIAQWNRVRLPSYSTGFESQAHAFSIYIVQIIYMLFELECEKNENKQKEAEIGPFLKKERKREVHM